jgi:hypothetical protein
MLKTRRHRAALIALAFCVALAGAGALGEGAAAQRRRGDSGLLARAQSYTGDRFNFETTTPRGARVVAVSRPNAQTLSAIDRGLAELFAAARRRGYRERLSHPDYTIFIARPDRTKDSAGAYSPDIALGAAQYAGSVYDQGGYVFAAGLVLSTQGCAFVIAEHERNWQRVADVARYEGEHIVLYHNDRRLYSQTADHSQGGGHPIFQ